MNDIQGWFTFSPLYDEMINKYERGVFCEIGCWFGASATYLLDKINKSGKNIHCIFIDTWSGEPNVPYQMDILKENGPHYVFNKFLENIKSINNNNYSIVRKDSVAAAKDFSDEFFDFVFIDGWHEQCYEDVISYWPKVTKGGVLAGHDWDGQVVANAVIKFCKENSLEYQVYGSPLQCWRINK